MHFSPVRKTPRNRDEENSAHKLPCSFLYSEVFQPIAEMYGVLMWPRIYLEIFYSGISENGCGKTTWKNMALPHAGKSFCVSPQPSQKHSAQRFEKELDKHHRQAKVIVDGKAKWSNCCPIKIAFALSI